MRVTIDGKEYDLIPVEEETDSLLDDYKVSRIEPSREGNSGIKQDEVSKIKEAEHKISDYRERYKQKKVKIGEITAPPKRYSKIDKASSSLEGYEYKGEKLFVGPGLEEEI